MSSRQLAQRFIRDQFQIMAKYGNRPRLTVVQRKDLLASVERTFDSIRASVEAERPARTKADASVIR
jgi:hypothetical protein